MNSTTTSIKLSTPESLLNSIRTDWQTYRWFAFLIQNNLLQRELINLSAILQNNYIKIRISIFIQSLVLAGMGMLYFYLEQHFQPLTIMVGCLASLFLFYFSAYKFKQKNILEICKTLIQRDFDTLHFENKSLYQISEEYGKTYRVASLVDTISLTDRWMRWGLLSIIVTASFIFPLKFWEIIIASLTGILIFCFILHSSIAYTRLLSSR
jgi:hypothetical protein